FLRNDRWVGRFYVDVAGQSKRMRKAIVLGMKTELTKTEARLKLLTTITAEGVNTPAHLERSLRPPKVFNDVADAWEAKRLPQFKVLFRLAGTSGLRAGELLGLHVEDLDLSRGVVRVRRSIWLGKEVTPKSRKGYRDVWIDSDTSRMIREYLGSRASGLVFQTRNSTPLSAWNVVRQVLSTLCDQHRIVRGWWTAVRHCGAR